MTNRDDAFSLAELWSIAWHGKYVIIGIAVGFAALAVLYGLLAQKWYRAEVVLSPAQEQSTLPLGGSLGGFAALAGLRVGGGNVVEAVATLKSRQFARDFIEENSLVTVFFIEDWDPEAGRWLLQDPEEWPDVGDAVDYFQNELLSVTEDRQTGLVTLAVTWNDPIEAAAWADELARRVNNTLRERALRLSTANVEYLQSELGKADVVEMRQTTARLLEAELQKLMLARGNEEFAFRIIDPAAEPREPAWPRPALLAVLGTLLGGIIGFLAVFIAHTNGAARACSGAPAR